MNCLPLETGGSTTALLRGANYKFADAKADRPTTDNSLLTTHLSDAITSSFLLLLTSTLELSFNTANPS